MRTFMILGVVILGAMTLGAQQNKTDLEKSVSMLESRVEVLEGYHKAPTGVEVIESNSSIVAVRVLNKKARRKSELKMMADYYDILFDLEFKGTKILGNRRIKDIQGNLTFSNSFGDKIISIRVTERLDIGAGQFKISRGNMIPFEDVLHNRDWQRVMATDLDEMVITFEVTNAIYEKD